MKSWRAPIWIGLLVNEPTEKAGEQKGVTWNEFTVAKKVRQLQDNIALFEYYNMWILISRQFTALSLY